MLGKFTVLLLAAFALASAEEDTSCKKYSDEFCGGKEIKSTAKSSDCSPRYGAVELHKGELHKFIKEHVGNSFEYLFEWANFNHYAKDREGFAKLYRKLSDDTWEDTIKLVKYLGKRGVKLNFGSIVGHEVKGYREHADGLAPPPEIEATSLARVLDLHKMLAVSGNKLHEMAIKHDSSVATPTKPTTSHHDIELAHFIEEEFSGKHAQVVRDLAGHSSDLRRLLTEGYHDNVNPASGLYVHLFDEYLRKLY